MASVNVTIRMDENLKKQSEELFNELGLSLSAAFNIFARQSVREQGIPFEITKKVHGISYSSKESLSKAADDELELHLKAYQELAK